MSEPTAAGHEIFRATRGARVPRAAALLDPEASRRELEDVPSAP